MNTPKPPKVAQSKLHFWLLTVAALAGMVLTASLGRWQLDRAAQKEAFQSSIDQQARLPMLDGVSLVASGRALVGSGDVLAPEEVALVHRTVALTGQWLPQYTVFLDNRQMNGRPGFFVLTPLQLQGIPAVVLVQRGWAARNFQDRMALPAVDTPDGLVQVQGRVAHPAKSGPGSLFRRDRSCIDPPDRSADRPRQRRVAARMASHPFRCGKALRLRLPVVRAQQPGGYSLCLVPTCPTCTPRTPHPPFQTLMPLAASPWA